MHTGADTAPMAPVALAPQTSTETRNYKLGHRNQSLPQVKTPKLYQASIENWCLPEGLHNGHTAQAAV
jgi:hypothetical protein